MPRPATPANLLVIGAGYVGLVTAVGFAALGHRVTLVESRPDRLDALRLGRVPIFEAGLQEAYDDVVAAGRLEVTDVAGGAPDAVLVCVGTPIDADGRSDLSQLRAAMDDIRTLLPSGSTVVIRSTLPPGSTLTVGSWGGVATTHLFTNPEFLRQGTALADFHNPSRVVIGRFPDADAEALLRVTGLYAPFPAPLLVMDAAAAEIAKNGANAFLALKLSFANEMAAMAEVFGTDVDQVMSGITSDPRIGSLYMRPGLGFGGSCLPKELRALTAAGQSRGLPMLVTTAASDSNAAQQRRFSDRIDAALGGLAGRRIALLGLAFKAGTDDVRESPPVEIARQLAERGATVVATDPQASTNALVVLPDLSVVPTAMDALVDADACVIGTEWPEYATLDWGAARAAMRGSLVVDGRRLLDGAAMRTLGFRYIAVGTSHEASIVVEAGAPAQVAG